MTRPQYVIDRRRGGQWQWVRECGPFRYAQAVARLQMLWGLRGDSTDMFALRPLDGTDEEDLPAWDGELKVRYLPGQVPYTPEELSRVQQLMDDALDAEDQLGIEYLDGGDPWRIRR